MVKVGTTYNGQVSTNENRFFKIPITKEGIEIELHIKIGKLFMYGSHSNPYPNEAHYDVTRRRIKEGQAKKVAIACNQKIDGIYYCSLYGIEDCTFSLKVEVGFCD